MINRKNQRQADGNSYVQKFIVAQMNLNELIQEERLRRRLNRNAKQNLKN